MKRSKNKPPQLRQFNPLNDYFFYKIMGEKGSEIQLLSFLNAVLGRKGYDRFTSVEILEDKTFTPELLGDKSVTFDVRAILQSKTRVNVEVQISNQHNMNKRSLFYWSREYMKSLKAGGDYQDLPDVIAVNIVNFNFPPLRKYHTCFHIREDDEREMVLTNSLEIHFINMVQYRKLIKKFSDSLSTEPLIRWLAWFNQSSPPELVAEVKRMGTSNSAQGASNRKMLNVPAQENFSIVTNGRAPLGGRECRGAIQSADERLVYLSGDEDAVRAYEVRFKAMCDLTSIRNDATRTGHAKGFKKA
jgi:predicted transposase/invertase (TIGR01784 family)